MLRYKVNFEQLADESDEDEYYDDDDDFLQIDNNFFLSRYITILIWYFQTTIVSTEVNT